MNFIDLIILVSVITIVSLIVYYNFIKHGFSSCKSCPEAKKGEGIKSYYKKVCEMEKNCNCK